jgi:TM2 domain-containing membrane protein YozV
MEVKMEEKIIIQKRPPKSPVAAGILSGLFPFGVGAMYNGQFLKGIIYLVIFAGLVTLQGHGKGQPFFGLVLAGFYFYQIIEAVQSANAINRRALTGKEDESAKIEDQILEPAKSGSIFWGIVLVGLGALFLLANFRVIDYDVLLDFWPVAVIGLGVKLVIDYARAKKGK